MAKDWKNVGRIQGEQGEKGEKGDKGDPFTYEDFTPEQLEGLKGEKGDQGERGEKGEKGDKGDDANVSVSENVIHLPNGYVQIMDTLTLDLGYTGTLKGNYDYPEGVKIDPATKPVIIVTPNLKDSGSGRLTPETIKSGFYVDNVWSTTVAVSTTTNSDASDMTGEANIMIFGKNMEG